jgi:hypothetical protein
VEHLEVVEVQQVVDRAVSYTKGYEKETQSITCQEDVPVRLKLSSRPILRSHAKQLSDFAEKKIQ